MPLEVMPTLPVPEGARGTMIEGAGRRSGMSKDRIKWVQCARGLTISLVVLGHMFYGVNDAVGIDPATFDYWNVSLAIFRMPLFFFVAGIFAFRALQRPGEQILNRTIMQLMWVYLVWSVVHYVIKVPFGGYGNRAMEADAIFLIAYRPVEVLWFIYVLMLFYGLTWLLRKVPAIVLLTLSATLAAGYYEVDPKWIQRASNMYVYFLMGYFGSEWVIACSAHLRRWHAVVLVPLFTAVTLTLVGTGLRMDPTLWFAGSLLGIVAMVSLCVAISDSWAGDALRFLGDRSLPIFVLHTIVGPTTRVILTSTGITREPAVLVPVCTVVAIAVPVLAAVLADRFRMPWVFNKPAWFAIPFGRKPDARPRDDLPGTAPGRAAP
jgi:uncharacterized membrane protein YcfT